MFLFFFIFLGENLDWKKTRDQFSNSSNTFTCLTGAIICKTISSSRKTG